MLDNNTNKVVWVGVAIGVVGLLGAGAILFFPSLKTTMYDSIRRTELLMATHHSNLFVDSKTDVRHATHLMGDYVHDTKLIRLSDTDYRIDMTSDSQTQGFYYGYGGVHNDTLYFDDLRPGDGWTMDADIRVVSGDSSKVELSNMYVQDSDLTATANHVGLSSNWQHFSSAGIRKDDWGAPVWFFHNNTGQPVSVEVKNIEIHRK